MPVPSKVEGRAREKNGTVGTQNALPPNIRPRKIFRSRSLCFLPPTVFHPRENPSAIHGPRSPQCCRKHCGQKTKSQPYKPVIVFRSQKHRFFKHSKMVAIEEVNTEPSPSEERLLDAEEIEKVAETMTRPTAKMQLTSLAKKLRKESEALKRLEESQAKSGDQQQPQKPETVPPVVVAEPPRPLEVAPPVVSASAKYTPIDRFSFDAGEYNSQFITLYIPLPGVGSIPKDKISCDFTKDSFNLIVNELSGKSYRLFKDSLEKDIVPDKCKYIVKADKVVIKLAKVKGEYGSYDYWTKLTDPKKKDKKKADNPASSVMDLMKEMYDSGDDKMKKMIGETMMKQRNGELGNEMGMGGGLGDFKDSDF